MTQETDRELLEWAAKAAGMKLANQMIESGWNPLTDDGDALRLATDLGLWITREKMTIQVRYFTGDYLAAPTWVEGRTDSQNRYAATRRAIVRAAANIGKAM